MVKLVDKIKDAATPWFSFEFFPPRTEEVCIIHQFGTNLSPLACQQFMSAAVGPRRATSRKPTGCRTCWLQGVENLFDRQDRMAGYGPMFCDITWGAGGTTAELTLDIATKMQNMVIEGRAMADAAVSCVRKAVSSQEQQNCADEIAVHDHASHSATLRHTATANQPPSATCIFNVSQGFNSFRWLC